MENTLENKAKFFAQYYGQNVFRVLPNSKYRTKSHFGDLNDDDYLLLKPLSSITDEDKLKITLMYLEMESAPYDNVMYCFKNSVKPLLDKVEKMQGRITDYLRSKGYALPYMGLSVEKQIEYGWIKLAE